MGRRVTRVRDEVWYVPNISGMVQQGDKWISWVNRKDPKPFRVKIRPLTAGDLERLESGVGQYTRGDRSVNFYDRTIQLRDQMITENVIEVEEYELEDKNGNLVSPKDGAELVQYLKLHASGTEADAVLSDIMEALRDHSKLAEGIAGE